MLASGAIIFHVRHSGFAEYVPSAGESGETADGIASGMARRTRGGISGGMTGLDPTLSTIENYRRFAHDEAAGRSPSYEQLAYAVAEDDLILPFLANLPAAKRQPNLLFAAARFLLGAPPEPVSLRSLVAERPDDLSSVMLARRTQTNEAARCALLLPALASLPQPLALVEVGAAAGLTLLPDLYSYSYSYSYSRLLRSPGSWPRCRGSDPVMSGARAGAAT